MSKEIWLNNAAELRGFLANRHIAPKMFATRAGLTIEQFEKILSGKKAVDLTTMERIKKAKKSYPLTKQLLEIQRFVQTLQHAWKKDFNAMVARNEISNTFVVKMDGIDSSSEIMQACVNYSGHFENKWHSPILFIDAKDTNFCNLVWENVFN